MDSYKDFAELTKRFRKKHGYTQQMLAEKASVSKDTIKAWECGKRTPSYTLMNMVFEEDEEFMQAALHLKDHMDTAKDIVKKVVAVSQPSREPAESLPDRPPMPVITVDDSGYDDPPRRINFSSDHVYEEFLVDYNIEKAQRAECEIAYMEKMNLSSDEAAELETAARILFSGKDVSIFRFLVPYATARYTMINSKTELLGFFKGRAKCYITGTEEADGYVMKEVKEILDAYLKCISDTALYYSSAYGEVSRYKHWRGLEAKYDMTYATPRFLTPVEYMKALSGTGPDFSSMYGLISGPRLTSLSLEDLYTICRMADSDNNNLLVAYGMTENPDVIMASGFEREGTFNRCPEHVSIWGYCHRSYEYFPGTYSSILDRLVKKNETIAEIPLPSKLFRKPQNTKLYTINLELAPLGAEYIRWYERLFT